ncbi:TPA: hypothetical protein JBC98_15500 [Legionella pneumophila subsp. pneumophila]|nr:hypothetical protein [Legionella pneumophila]HAT8728059.1 hypothetical protein [Legionella pneumophila]HAT9526015.1 hypothetical protein [Legionella pneumophila subsp. pneumophila]
MGFIVININVVCYIPAKGNSSELPNKNLKLLHGRSLVEYTLESARNFLENKEHVLVSSESREIERITNKFGMTFLSRPAQLSLKTATVADVLNNDILYIRELIGDEGIIVVLLPSSPLRSLGLIQSAYDKFTKMPSYTHLVSISPYPSPLHHRMNYNDINLRLEFCAGIEQFTKQSQRQSHSKHYFPNGALYMVRVRDFIENKSFYKEGSTMGFETDRISAIDIDDNESFQLAEFILMGREYLLQKYI